MIPPCLCRHLSASEGQADGKEQPGRGFTSLEGAKYKGLLPLKQVYVPEPLASAESEG